MYIYTNTLQGGIPMGIAFITFKLKAGPTLEALCRGPLPEGPDSAKNNLTAYFT